MNTSRTLAQTREDHQRGVGLALKKEARKALLRWNLVRERIMSARFNY